jgi:uncharacterized repeat protein (TIGR03803 family)
MSGAERSTSWCRPTDRWVESVIYQFKGGPDGSIPIDRLVAGASGSLYGVTADGGLPGPNGHFVTGTVFRLDPPRAGAAHWTKTILYEFQGAEDGYSPQGGVTLDEDGTIYGTTEFGGANLLGTVFKLTANTLGQPWTKTILRDFAGGPGDGADPTGPVTARCPRQHLRDDPVGRHRELRHGLPNNVVDDRSESPEALARLRTARRSSFITQQM